MSAHYKIPKWTVWSFVGLVATVLGVAVLADSFASNRYKKATAWPVRRDEQD